MGAMIDDPQKYFRGLIPDRSDLLREMERSADKDHIPIIGPVVGELLYILARTTGARRILELGTAHGYSTIYLAQALSGADSKVVTLEWDGAMAEWARENIRKAGLSEKVEIKVGDAIELMESMRESFDLIFLDIDKEGYSKALPGCERLLKIGGLLVADNVAFADAHAFNQQISDSPKWRSVHLYSFLPDHSPEHDGLAFAIRES